MQSTTRTVRQSKKLNTKYLPGIAITNELNRFILGYSNNTFSVTSSDKILTTLTRGRADHFRTSVPPATVNFDP